jgi:ABC-type sugar transport system permease subunit
VERVINRRLTLGQKRQLYGLFFVSPWLVGFLWFFVANILTAIRFSMSELKINSTGGYALLPVGFDNYTHALTRHSTFNRILTESVFNIILDVPLIIFFSLFIAILLNQRFKGRTMVRAIFFLPVVLLSPAIISALDSAMQNIAGGMATGAKEMQASGAFNARYLINTFISLGFPAELLQYVEFAVNRVYDIVKASGVQILIFLAALQSIPGSLYEVAKIEGATAYETFWKVTLPMVSPMILTNLVYTIADYFIRSRIVEVTFVTAFTNFNFGLSSAMAILSTVSIGLVLVVAGYFISKKVFYYH